MAQGMYIVNYAEQCAIDKIGKCIIQRVVLHELYFRVIQAQLGDIRIPVDYSYRDLGDFAKAFVKAF